MHLIDVFRRVPALTKTIRNDWVRSYTPCLLKMNESQVTIERGENVTLRGKDLAPQYRTIPTILAG